MSFVKVTPVAEGMDDMKSIFVNTDRILGIGVEEIDDGEFLMLIFEISKNGEIVGMSIREALDDLPVELVGK